MSSDKKIVAKTIRLKSGVVDQIEAQMLIENRNFSNMVETIIMNYFSKEAPVKRSATERN